MTTVSISTGTAGATCRSGRASSFMRRVHSATAPPVVSWVS